MNQYTRRGAETVRKMIEFINTYVIGAALPALLAAAGVFLGVGTRVWSPRVFGAGVRSLFEKGQTNGAVSPLRALSVALAGTLGVGNIVGVSAAIWWGGAGAVFWMWLSALLAAPLKYAETVLGVKFRRRDGERLRGGAPLYIKKAFAERKLPRLGAFLGALFSLLCIADALSMGCVVQVNAVAGAMDGAFGLDRRICGILMALAAFAIASGGLGRISAACGALVPFMTAGFTVLSAAALVIRAPELPRVFREVMSGAFSFISEEGARSSGAQAIFAGIGGFFVSRAVRYGVMRGLISNEAGCGTSPLAHSAADTDSAAKQGFLGIAEVVVDTVVLCTATAFVILASYGDVAVYGENSVMMTIGAYTAALGNWAKPVLAVAVLLFGFATVVCWAYYGQECIAFLGLSQRRERIAVRIFNILYAASAYIGATSPPGGVWTLADFSIGLMTFLNITALILLRRYVKNETDGFARGYHAKK